MAFEFRYTIPGQISRSIPLDQPRMIIGALLSNHIVIRAPLVEPIHGMIELQADGRWLLTDLGSETGTKLNGQSISVETSLKPGDRITIGTIEIEFAEKSQEFVPPAPNATRLTTPPAFPPAVPPAMAGILAPEDPIIPAPVTEQSKVEQRKDLLFSPREARPRGDYLEVVAYWGDTVLDVDLFHSQIKNKNLVTIGDPTKANFIAAGADNIDRYLLATVEGGGYSVNLGPGMQTRLRRKGRVEKVDNETTSLTLSRNDVVHIKYGSVRYFMCFVSPPELDIPRSGPRDPFLMGLGGAGILVFLLTVPALWLATPVPKTDDQNDIYEIVNSPEELKKPEPEKIKKPEVKLAEKKEQPTPPPPKAPPPPKPKPVQPAKPVEKEKVVQQKPVEKPVPKPVTTQALKTPDVPQQKPVEAKPAGAVSKTADVKPSSGTPSTGSKTPDMKFAGPQNGKAMGAAGGAKGSGNNQTGGAIKGNKAASVQGVEGVNNEKASGVNLSKLGLGVGKVLNKTGGIPTNFKSDAGGAGGGMGSGAKTYGLGGVGTGKSLGLAGTGGAVNNFGSGSGGFMGGQGGSGGRGGAGGGPGFGSGGNGQGGAGGHGRANISIPPGDPAVSGGLTAQEIMAVIRANLNQIRHCYEQLLQRSPSAAGKITVNFVVSTSGGVQTVNVQDSSIDDASMRGCVTGRISRWAFPKPRGGQPVTVSYPFVFNPL